MIVFGTFPRWTAALLPWLNTGCPGPPSWKITQVPSPCVSKV
jgi:hypothetical protein